MTCFHPLKCYRSKNLSVNGKRKIVFNIKDSNDESLEIPCGQCIGCRLERSRQWAVRISNEASLYENNCFITLTYAPEHLPSNGSLNLDHFQRFLKRLRKKHHDQSIRFFHCGEYGEQLGRPHYHACLLNFDFADKYHHRISARGDYLYRSPTLEQLWPYGQSEIGAVTFESAAYVARYITKKITGDVAEAHYTVADPETGELFRRSPEYTTMSRRPGIGAPWLEKYHTDVYNHDYIITPSGAKTPPPKYYDNYYERLNPQGFQRVKLLREENEPVFGDDKYIRRRLDNTPERLKVRETVLTATVTSTLNRNLEKE